MYLYLHKNRLNNSTQLNEDKIALTNRHRHSFTHTATAVLKITQKKFKNSDVLCNRLLSVHGLEKSQERHKHTQSQNVTV